MLEQLELFSSIDNRKNWILFPSHRIAILKNDYWLSEVSLELVKEKDWLTNEKALKVTCDTEDNVRAFGFTIIKPLNQSMFHCKPPANWRRTYSGCQPIKIVDI
jgi:hypothetical protein